MSTAEILSPNPEMPQQLPVPEQGEQVTGLRHIEISDQTYTTNLPEGIHPFDSNNLSLRNTTLVPAELDKLPVGDFFISRTEIDEDGEEVETRRDIGIINGEQGAVIDRRSLGMHGQFETGNRTLLGLVGFEIQGQGEEARVSGIPTPETFKSAVGRHGVEVAFFPEHSLLKPKVFLGAYKEGLYPVATGEEGYYIHDISDDHITALILGGDPLKEALKNAAARGLEGSDSVVGDVTGDLDAFTATLRAIVAPSSLTGEAYGEEQGRATLHDYGNKLGMAPETVETIIETAQTNGKALGLDIKNLR